MFSLMNHSLFERIDAEPIIVEKQEGTGMKTVAKLPSLDIDVPVFHPLETPSMHEITFLPDLDTARKGGTKYGSMIHETIEKLPNRKWTMDDLKDTDLHENDKNKILQFSDSDLYQECLKMEIHKEYPFFITHKDLRMSGVMDFVAIGDNQIILIDFKTDNAPVNEIVRRYTQQITAYKKALRILYPDKQITAYLWSFHNDQEIKI